MTDSCQIITVTVGTQCSDINQCPVGQHCLEGVCIPDAIPVQPWYTQMGFMIPMLGIGLLGGYMMFGSGGNSVKATYPGGMPPNLK